MAHVTALYAALFALLFLFFSVQVARQRKSARVSVGHNGNGRLERLARIHGNAAEYGPLILLLMALAELQSTSIYLIHAMGIALIVGRLLHAHGMAEGDRNLPFRVAGMLLTMLCLFAGAVILLLGVLRGL